MAGAYSVERWKGVAELVGRTVGSCQRYARRKHDPLPLYSQLGRVVAKPDEVQAWLARQERPTRARRRASS